MATLLLASWVFAQQPAQWSPGEVTKIERHGSAYDYSLFDGECGFIGRSDKKLDYKLGEKVKFRLSGKQMLIMDHTGKTHRTKFVLQWLSPPPPPPIRKQDK
jgi:hypothetical protein